MTKNKIINFCDLLIEWGFYVVLVAVAFSTSLVEIASTTMIVAWIMKKILDRDFNFLRSVPSVLLLMFFFWNILSCVNSGYFKESFRGIFKIAEYGMLFFVASTTLNKKRIAERAFTIMALSAVIICLNGFFQYFTGADLLRGRELIKNDYLRRISSSFVHPNDFGVYLLVLSMCFTGVLLRGKIAIKYSISLVAPLGVTLLSLVMTKSRGAWLAFTAAFLALGAVISRKALILCVVLLLVLFMVMPFAVQERVYDLTNFQSGTTWERLKLWEGATNMIKVHPVLGFGVNTYSKHFADYRPSDYPDVRYAHNCYLQMASEIGLPGMVLFILFLAAVFIICLKNMGRLTDSFVKGLSSGLFAGLIGFALNSMVDTHLYSVSLAVMFYVLLGFFYALTCNLDEK